MTEGPCGLDQTAVSQFVVGQLLMVSQLAVSQFAVDQLLVVGHVDVGQLLTVGQFAVDQLLEVGQLDVGHFAAGQLLLAGTQTHLTEWASQALLLPNENHAPYAVR